MDARDAVGRVHAFVFLDAGRPGRAVRRRPQTRRPKFSKTSSGATTSTSRSTSSTGENSKTSSFTSTSGYSYKLGDYTVNRVIAEGLPISAALGLLALAFALSLGLVAGITSASRRGSIPDLVLMTLATIGIALPNFVIAGLAILLFVFLIPIFPAAGWGSFDQLVLPALCLGAPHAADVARITRTSMLDVLSQDHIRTARAKGLSRARVIWGHALPAALLPVVSYLGPAAAYILTGSLVIEQIFAIPGLGSHFVEAALQRDYTLAMGCVLLYTVILFTMNMLVDLSYTVLDPRVELD